MLIQILYKYMLEIYMYIHLYIEREYMKKIKIKREKIKICVGDCIESRENPKRITKNLRIPFDFIFSEETHYK